MNATAVAAVATMATTIAPSPSPPRPAAPPVGGAGAGALGHHVSARAFFSNMAIVLGMLACVALYSLLLDAACFLLRWLARRRDARVEPQQQQAEARARAQEPKLPSGAGAGAASAGVWAEAECAICLSELEGGARVRVLPACGHGFHLHGACVEGWLAARASCPTCRAPWEQ